MRWIFSSNGPPENLAGNLFSQRFGLATQFLTGRVGFFLDLRCDLLQFVSSSTIGFTKDADFFTKRAELIRNSINQKLFDREKGVYVDGEPLMPIFLKPRHLVVKKVSAAEVKTKLHEWGR